MCWIRCYHISGGTTHVLSDTLRLLLAVFMLSYPLLCLFVGQLIYSLQVLLSAFNYGSLFLLNGFYASAYLLLKCMVFYAHTIAIRADPFIILAHHVSCMDTAIYPFSHSVILLLIIHQPIA